VRIHQTLIAAILISASSGTLAQSPVPTEPVCLRATDIDSTSVLDNHTVVFRMNNGALWTNTLQAECPGLKMSGGFDYVIRGGTVCGNEQRIRVHDMQATCFLGPFTRMNTK
jgi:hypothetical protein